ncbi:hypothetical protein [Nonomuraea jabiensis]|uniref:hypothetical protein n=1 Tax=Nonomuraea jabiensis TaxID=882448 RepID=UPI003D7310F5
MSGSVRDLIQTPAVNADPIRGFAWRREQRHRPGLAYMVSTERHHGAESLEESRVLLALDFAAELIDVVSQPLRLRFDAAKRRSHVPDFLMVARSGTWLIDVRPEPLIGDEDIESFAAAAEVAAACGWHYTVAARVARTRLGVVGGVLLATAVPVGPFEAAPGFAGVGQAGGGHVW